jgi:dienelactone hydrolase
MNQLSFIVPVGRGIHLPSDIALPDHACGLVLFAHGSGSSRHSPRNIRVAGILNRASIATVLIDLLTEEEEVRDQVTAELRFDIPLLGRRLVAITDWIARQRTLESLGIGYFGASTGAAAALVAAAERPEIVRAVVSRGGRPDLAGPSLARVTAPTLFIVGARDETVLHLNRVAIAQLPAETERQLLIVPGATHLFEEPGTLDSVAASAKDWFRQYLSPRV